jgi:dolichyl-phosphate beta-glucosyltransferase
MEAGSPARVRNQDEPLFSLVFPAYNPGPVLERTWQEVERFLGQARDPWEILFVCDGCTDGTPARLAELIGELSPRVQVLSYAPNRGKGHAVRLGLEVAGGAWRLFTDIDLAYSLDDVVRVAEALRRGADVAIASRGHRDSQILMPARLQGYAYRRHLQSLAFSRLVRLLLPLRERDTQAGLKGLSADACRALLPRLTCNGFGFDCELLTACVRYGLAVREVPVCVRFEDRASTTSIRTMGRMLGELWQIRRAWRRAPGSEDQLPPASEKRAA